MIARAPYLFLLLIIVPDLYLDYHYWRRRHTMWQRLLRWLPTIVLVAYTLFLTYERICQRSCEVHSDHQDANYYSSPYHSLVQ